MTWHAARFLLLQGLTLGFAAALSFAAWAVAHRGRHLSRAWSSRLLATSWMRRLSRRSHPLALFIERHFAHVDRRSWIRTIAGIVIVAATLSWCTTIVRGVLSDGAVAAADRRLHNTLRMFHSENLHVFYSSVTDLATATFIVPVALALAALFWRHRRNYEARLFIVAIAGASILSTILKYLVRRPRPLDAMPFVSGPSFPSGHTLAAAGVYGILAFLLLREKPRKWWHVGVAIVLLSIIVLVAFSRVYLGMHWPHDVVASLDIGAAWLACLTMLVRFRPDGTKRDTAPEPIRASIFAGVTAAIVVYAVVLCRFERQPESRPALRPPATVSADALQTFPAAIHRTSEDLVGGPMEPLSFLFVGTSADVQRTFERAGWFLADTPSARGLGAELWAVVRNRPDPHGPATPAYYQEQPQDLTFERSGTPDGSIRKRHHIRIWQTSICIAPSCTMVWGATCSYDMGVEFVAKLYLLTHRIDPRIDVEREFVAATLRAAGARDIATVVVTGPRHGRNAGGDSFTTDGRAHVMLM
jgi:membrane-associated phospholipid phosphatase